MFALDARFHQEFSKVSLVNALNYYYYLDEKRWRMNGTYSTFLMRISSHWFWMILIRFRANFAITIRWRDFRRRIEIFK